MESPRNRPRGTGSGARQSLTLPGGFTGLGAGGPGPRGPVAGGGFPEAGPGDWPRRAAAAGRRAPGERAARRRSQETSSRGEEAPKGWLPVVAPRELIPQGPRRGRPVPWEGSYEGGVGPLQLALWGRPETRRPGPRGPRDCPRFLRDRPRVHRDHGPGPAPQGRPLRLPLGPGPASCNQPPLRPASRNPPGGRPPATSPQGSPPRGHPPSPGPAPAFRGPTAVPPP